MKKILIYQLWKAMESKPALKKRLKVFAIVAAVSFVVVGGLATWATISVVSHLTSSASQFEGAALTESLSQQLESFPSVSISQCWDQAVSMTRLEVWTEHSLAENFQSLKQACLGQATQSGGQI